jgi:flagellar protein FliL
LLALLLGFSATTARAASDSPSGKGEAVPNGPLFVKLPIFQIPVIERDRVTRRVSVAVALELVQGMTQDNVTPKQPLLVDAFLSDLYAVFSQRANSSRVADGRLIRTRLQQIADRILGPGVVRQVLIEQLFEQQLEN